MVSSELWTDTDSKLRKIFLIILENKFAVHSDMTVADLLQLSPFKNTYIFPRV